MIFWVLGGLFLSLYVNRGDPPIEKRLFTRGCQVIVSIQIAMTILLLLNMYTPFSQWIVWSIPWLFGITDWIGNKEKDQTLRPSNLSWHHIVIFAIGIGYVWHATPPPWMRDSLTYHLSLAKQYAIAGRYVETDLVVFAYFPQGWQSILTALHNPITGGSLLNPRYLSVGICLLTAIGIFGWIKEQVGSKEWALTGSVVYLLTPSIVEFGTSCYVQPWLTAMCLWILMSIHDRKSVLYIGGLVGVACSLKYSALILPLLILPILYTRSKNVKEASIFVCGVCITGGIFYLRNLLETGNPLFPMMYSSFGGTGWDSWRAMAYEHTLNNYGMGRSIEDYILLPFRLFSTTDMTRYFQGSLGIGWLLMLVISLWKNRTQTGSQWMWLLLSGWFVFWALQVQQVRFFLPMLPLVVMICIPTLSKWKPRSWGIWISLSVLWSLSPVQSLITNQQGHVYWNAKRLHSVDKSRSIFLDHRLPENHPVYTHINALNTEKVWLVWMRGYHYYLNKPVRLDNVFGATRFEQLLWNHSIEEIETVLRAEDISHIVINWRFFLQDNNADHLGSGASIVIQDRFSQLIQTNTLQPIRQWGPVWIYELEESSSDE